MMYDDDDDVVVRTRRECDGERMREPIENTSRKFPRIMDRPRDRDRNAEIGMSRIISRQKAERSYGWR